MSNARILFKVPQDFQPLIPVISDFPAERTEIAYADHAGLSEIDYDNLDNLDAQLAEAVGGWIDIEFDEPEPADAILAFVKALDRADVPYWAVHDSYTEPSRGTRYNGRVFLRMQGSTTERTLSWADGDPKIDVETLQAVGGFSAKDIEAVEATFFNTAKPPTP